MSKFEQIISFVTVVEENSFAAAASKQGISKAAISRQVSNLEAGLGVQLLRRTTRKLVLTEVGQQYYEQSKYTLQALQEAEDRIAGNQNEATGILRIVSNRYFGIQYLLPHLQTFMSANPKLRIQLELAERFPDFEKEAVDILFGVSVEGPEHLVRKRITTTRYMLCAAPKYLKKFGTPKTPTDLIKHHYITHSIRKPNNIIYFNNDKEIQVEPILFLNDERAMRECAIKGIGIIKVHEHVVNAALANGQLVELLPKWREPRIPIYLYYQQSRYLQPKIRKFIDFYTTQLK